jgi:hypothetical protein
MLDGRSYTVAVRLYTYIIRFDTGFAPNPFYGFCALACCKPRDPARGAAGFCRIRKETLGREPDAFSSLAEEHRATTADATAALIASDPANNYIVRAFVKRALVGTAGFYRAVENELSTTT